MLAPRGCHVVRLRHHAAAEHGGAGGGRGGEVLTDQVAQKNILTQQLVAETKTFLLTKFLFLALLMSNLWWTV